MEADGRRPVSVPVDRLSTSCPSSPRSAKGPMTTTGTIEPARPGANIVVRYTPPGGSAQPFERTVQTDAKGGWSDSISPGQYPNGEWRIEPRFDGDGTHPALKGDACTVKVG